MEFLSKYKYWIGGSVAGLLILLLLRNRGGEGRQVSQAPNYTIPSTNLPGSYGGGYGGAYSGTEAGGGAGGGYQGLTIDDVKSLLGDAVGNTQTDTPQLTYSRQQALDAINLRARTVIGRNITQNELQRLETAVGDTGGNITQSQLDKGLSLVTQANADSSSGLTTGSSSGLTTGPAYIANPSGNQYPPGTPIRPIPPYPKPQDNPIGIDKPPVNPITPPSGQNTVIVVHADGSQTTVVPGNTGIIEYIREAPSGGPGGTSIFDTPRDILPPPVIPAPPPPDVKTYDDRGRWIGRPGDEPDGTIVAPIPSTGRAGGKPNYVRGYTWVRSERNGGGWKRVKA